MQTVSNIPWYREPWPWLLMIAPASAIAAGAVTLALAVGSFDGLVAEDYYKQGLAVNQRLARAQSAQSMGLTGTLAIEASSGGAVRAHLQGEGALGAGPLVLTLTHPTRAGLDQRITLSAHGEGLYVGEVGALAAGRWFVILENATEQWRLRGELTLPRMRTATLMPGA